MKLLLFLLQVVIISLSGAMAPGPVTAAAIAQGQKSRYAGSLMAFGHGIIEFPLMLLIVLGIGKIFQSPSVKTAVGLIGGAVLLLLASQLIISLKNSAHQSNVIKNKKPIVTGLILSATNPYFLIWWATVGITIALPARELGALAFVLFALTHWLCDFLWLTTLSWTSFKGSQFLGPKAEKIILIICAAAMALFGLKFILNSAKIFL